MAERPNPAEYAQRAGDAEKLGGQSPDKFMRSAYRFDDVTDIQLDLDNDLGAFLVAIYCGGGWTTHALLFVNVGIYPASQKYTSWRLARSLMNTLRVTSMNPTFSRCTAMDQTFLFDFYKMV